MDMEIGEKIRQYLLEEFVYAEDGEETLKDDVSLLNEGILDSFAILSVINFLEETFKIEIHDQDVVPENLESILSMARFVERKLHDRTLVGHVVLQEI